MICNLRYYLLFIAALTGMWGVAPTSDAALFGFTPWQIEVWKEIFRTLLSAISPVDVILIGILIHARRKSLQRQ